MSEVPFVSIIIPCRNEKDYIVRCLESVIAFDYPKDRFEVIISDGMSTDGTRDLVQSFAQRFPYIRMLDNPRKVTPFALNIAIRASVGDVIVRLDAHADYPADYVKKCAEALYSTGADNVGGIRNTAPRSNTRMANTLAFAISSPFSAGNAVYRTGVEGRRWVDTVFGGCFRRDVFDRIGYFNEKLTRAQDREFNWRLRQAGGKILLDPEITCTYYGRTKYKEYCSWMWTCGSWPFIGSRLAGQKFIGLRNFVPLAFVLFLLCASVAALWLPLAQVCLAAVVLVYLAASLVAAAPLAKKQSDPTYFIIAPFVFLTTHVVYGVGSIYGIAKPLGQKQPEPVAVSR